VGQRSQPGSRRPRVAGWWRETLEGGVRAGTKHAARLTEATAYDLTSIGYGASRPGGASSVPVVRQPSRLASLADDRRRAERPNRTNRGRPSSGDSGDAVLFEADAGRQRGEMALGTLNSRARMIGARELRLHQRDDQRLTTATGRPGAALDPNLFG
jgi:hypothetical protein